ncbi:MAG: Hpt domain-containing protein, partial [Spirochaetota bacterium]|nr:Hpt domain-containing protein [Spirochaetota bacterium]
DIQTGISYTYNKENYIELLKMFDEKSPQRYEEIKTVIKKCSEDTCKKYTNTVHSLKNTAAMIGAKQLAEIALQLELAARKNDIVFLKAHHNELQTEYKIVEAEVKKMIKEGI